MQSVTKNGITITFPDDIEPGKSYAITYSAKTSMLSYDVVTDFWIVTKSGGKMKFSIKQLASKPLT